MIFIDRIDNQITLLNAQKDMLGKFHLKHIQRVEVKKIEDWSKVVAPHVSGNDIILSLPDNECYVRLFELPDDITDTAIHKSVLDKAHMVIPVSVDELAYDMRVLPRQSDATSKKILFAATQGPIRDICAEMRSSRANPILAIPRSLAQFEALKSIIGESEVLLAIDSPENVSEFTLFNKDGPIMTATENSTFDKPHGLANKRLNVIINTYGEKITGAILAGHAHTRAVAEFFISANIPLLDAKKILHKQLTQMQIQMPIGSSISSLSHLSLLGLVLLSSRKDSLNVISPASLNRISLASVPISTQPLVLSSVKRNYKPYIVAIGALLLVAGVYVSFFSHKQSASVEAPLIRPVAKTEYVTPTTTPTPTISMSKQLLKIKVLNGTGAIGASAKAAEFLKSLGYSSIDTGNADTYDYKETTIQTKQESTIYLPLIKEDLGKNYKIATATSVLKPSEVYDIIIIVGKK